MIIEILIKTVIIYFLVFIVLKFMGKREIGQLSLFDFVVLLIIADISVVGLEKEKMEFLILLLPIILLALIQKVIAWILLKFPKLRKMFDGSESVIIVNGKLNIKEMKKQNYNVDDLIVQMRLKNIRSLSQVKFAILEANGELSIFKYEENNYETVHTKSRTTNIIGATSGSDTLMEKTSNKDLYPFPLIVSGEIKSENLKILSLSRKWLIGELKKQGYEDYKNIYYASYDNKKLFIIDSCNSQ